MKNKRCNGESRGRQKKKRDKEIIVKGWRRWEWNYQEGGEIEREREKERKEEGEEGGRFIGRKGRKWRTGGDSTEKSKR